MLATLWFQYIFLALIIMISGSSLVRDAEIIADKTKLGGTLVGILLLAAITSLPELFNGIGAVLLAQVPDLTVGDIIGSLLINLVIFAVVILFLKSDKWQGLGTPSLNLSGVLSIFLIAFYILVHWLSLTYPVPALGWIGWYSFFILLFYFLAIYILFRSEKKYQALAGEQVPEKEHAIGLKKAIIGFAINSIVVVAAGTYLPVVAGHIAVVSGMANSFMGFIFLAIATSLPELVVVAGAVRLGLIHMALGDVFGSNLFDIAVFSFGDFLYFSSDLFSKSSGVLMIGAAIAILMTALILAALKWDFLKKNFALVRVVAVVVILLYFLAVILMYQLA